MGALLGDLLLGIFSLIGYLCYRFLLPVFLIFAAICIVLRCLRNVSIKLYNEIKRKKWQAAREKEIARKEELMRLDAEMYSVTSRGKCKKSYIP